jgi:hypothetical protein
MERFLDALPRVGLPEYCRLNVGQTPYRFAGVRNTSDCGHPRQATSPRRFSTHRRRLSGYCVAPIEVSQAGKDADKCLIARSNEPDIWQQAGADAEDKAEDRQARE